MPKWLCTKCNHEFWGWGVYYKYKVGNVLVCPDCDGHLVQEKEAKKNLGVIARLFDSDSAA